MRVTNLIPPTALAAIALLSASWYAPAFGIACIHSDELQLGTQTVKFICEGNGNEGISGDTASDSILFANIAATANLTNAFQVTLTEPGSSAVSDYVNIDPVINGGFLEELSVTLVSDNAVPLAVSPGNAVIEETGGGQNLDMLIVNFYGLSSSPPDVKVMSDVEVPEPASLAILASGLLGLGPLRRRRIPRH